MAFAELTSEPVDSTSLAQRVRGPQHGGCVTFQGDVRDNDNGKAVIGLFYHAYEELARKELARIVDEAEERWAGTSCAISHRIGWLEIGETSVAIAVAAPHRVEAFDACRWIIDTVKTSVPIWKREEFDGEGAVWIEGSSQIPASAAASA